MDLHQIFQGGYTDFKWRQLGEYLKGKQLSAGAGIKLETSTSSGSVISAKEPRQIRQSQAPPFSVLNTRATSSATWSVELQEGWVIERHTKYDSATDAIEYHEVEINGQPMSSRPRQEIDLENNDFVYVEYETDEEGFLNTTPTIKHGATVQNSTHHQPPSGAGYGYGGTYRVKIFKFVNDNGSPKIVYYQQSDIEHTRLPTFRNVGGARYIHKKWEGSADRYDFRTLKQIEPTGRNYGKVIVDFINNELDGQNDAIKFSAIAERYPQPQINVDDDGAGVITIKGNNNTGSLTWEYCEEEDGQTSETLLSWDDGLITSASASFKAGCVGLPTGSNGDILYNLNGTWTVLANPGAVPVGDDHWELWHDGNSPAWQSVP